MKTHNVVCMSVLALCTISAPHILTQQPNSKQPGTNSPSGPPVKLPQSPAPPAPQPTPDVAPLIEQVKQTAVFITGKYVRNSKVVQSDGTTTRQVLQQGIQGTGYLVRIDNPSKKFSSGYLVTNQHMLREPGPAGTQGEGPFFQSISVRVNLNGDDGEGHAFKVLDVPVMDAAGQMQCFLDSIDPTADLAVCPLLPDAKQYSIRYIPASLLLTDEKITAEHINESDDVFFAGLFAPFQGVKKNYPIVRHGKVAMLAGERIPSSNGAAELYLVDVMSFGGNSGSPVFVSDVSGGPFVPQKIYLLGTMQGYFDVGSPVVVQTALLSGIARENTGVAVVVIAKKIFEILDTPEVKYCSKTDLSAYFETSGNLSDAFATADEALALPELHNQYAWCTAAAQLRVKRIGEKLKLKTKHMLPASIATELPSLPTRTPMKVPVTVLPIGLTVATKDDQYLLTGSDDKNFYVLSHDFTDPRGRLLTFGKQKFTVTLLD